MQVGIITEFPSISVQSGPALHTRFLHDGLTKRSHEVTLLGPDTTGVAPSGDARTFLVKGYPYPSHPNVKVSVPSPLRKLLAPPKLDVLHNQTNTHMVEWANWIRKMNRTAVLNTNIIHLPSHSHFILSDRMYANPLIRSMARQTAYGVERDFARMYNEGDCMIVQSRYMVRYWEERGVNVPIEVVGRPIDPAKFSRRPGNDPFPSTFARGKRLVVVCRHDREKALDRLLDIFTTEIAPHDADVTLTLIGDGHAHTALVEQARRSPHANRIHFPGEVVHGDLVHWYGHADVFVYTSVSETFGNVVNEALWTGLPVVAMHDRMGVAHQVIDAVNGFLIEPEHAASHERFAEAVFAILGNPDLRRRLAESAREISRRNSAPEVVLDRFETIYENAIRRAHDQVRTPLSEMSTFQQRTAFARHIATWARYNYLLLAIANTSFKLGLGRDEKISTIAPDTQQRSTGTTGTYIAAE